MCVGLANGGYVEPKEERVSLLKPYTRFDKIKDMTLDEMAETMEKSCGKGCPLFDDCHVKSNDECMEKIKQWLESEAEE